MRDTAWLDARRGGIGGSESPAILGLDRYTSPSILYARKLGLLEEDPETMPMRLGRRLEAVIAEEYAERNGVQLDSPGHIIHARHTWLRGTPDRLVISQPLGVEIKAPGARMWREWGDETTGDAPDRYVIQCHHYMILTGLPAWDLVALIGGSDYRCYRIEADAELQAAMLERLGRWWHEHVVARVPPPIDGDERTAEWLNRRWRKIRPARLTATAELRGVAESLRFVRAELASAEVRRIALENQLKVAIGEYSGLQIDDDNWIDWKTCVRGLTDWKGLATSLGATREQMEQWRRKPTRLFVPRFAK